MSIEQEQQWITGEEFGRERRRLIEAGVPDDAPEFRALVDRVLVRDDYLYETYGKRYLASHPGKWIAISLGGEVVLRDTVSDVVWAAREKFGGGNASIRKLAPFPGRELLS